MPAKILGQSRAIAPLQSALQAGKLHHAYLFHGPMGVGKFTTARWLAEAVLCDNPSHGQDGKIDPCGDCESCRLMRTSHELGGTPHPDFHVVTKELARYSDDADIRQRKLRNIPVEVVRHALIEPVYRAPQRSSRKVFVVVDAHLLSDEGQNQLLKTLEEPPAGTHILLITSNENQLLATVRSRCQRIAFSPLNETDVSAWITQQNPGLTVDHQRWLTSFAEGSLGRVSLALRYGLHEWAEGLFPAMDRLKQGHYPIDLGQQMFNRIEMFSQQWADQHENASKEAANRQGFELALILFGGYLRQQLLESAGDCPPGDLENNEARLSPWLEAVDALRQAEQEQASNVKLDVVTDLLAARFHRAMTPAGTHPAAPIKG
jgi:DNA polymerase III delta' subunit